MIRVKVFDESHEKDLEDAVNVFLKKIDDSNFVDIKYQVGVSINDDENQIYCFSAMIVYKTCVGNTFIIEWGVPNFFVVKRGSPVS